jgi:uncharacterized hydantoinase/oxoprolinase family protein
MTPIIGWDLGGANLKLALLEAGRITQVAQVPCPVRQDRGKFDAALKEGLALCPPRARHAVTMTGDLSDVFSDRAEGVAYLVGMMRSRARSTWRQPIGTRVPCSSPTIAETGYWSISEPPQPT